MQQSTEWLSFENYIKYDRLITQGYYDIKHVRKSFYEALSILGKPDKRDTLVAITIRLKTRVKVKTIRNGVEVNEYMKTNWGIAHSASNRLHGQISKKFWGRRSKYEKLPYVRSIESNEDWDKDHIHALIRMKDLKLNRKTNQTFTTKEIEDTIYDIAYELEEVNERDRKKDKPPVLIRTFPYWEDKYNVLGRSIEYICKTSSKHYDPLILEDNKTTKSIKKTLNKYYEKETSKNNACVL